MIDDISTHVSLTQTERVLQRRASIRRREPLSLQRAVEKTFGIIAPTASATLYTRVNFVISVPDYMFVMSLRLKSIVLGIIE